MQLCVNVDNHIVDRCPLRKHGGRLQSLCNIEDDALNWLETAVTIYSTREMKIFCCRCRLGRIA